MHQQKEGRKEGRKKRGKEEKNKKRNLKEIMADASQASTANSISIREYFFVCLFEWAENNPNPFFVVVREVFSDTDVPESWFTKKLTASHLQQKTTFMSLKDKILSVFCKCEKGLYLIIIFNYLMS